MQFEATYSYIIVLQFVDILWVIPHFWIYPVYLKLLIIAFWLTKKRKDISKNVEFLCLTDIYLNSQT